jgi:dihydroorotase
LRTARRALLLRQRQPAAREAKGPQLEAIRTNPALGVTASMPELRSGAADAYTGAPNMEGARTNIVQDGKLLPAALEAKKRGVIFDVGHGGYSFDFTVAEVAIPQGCAPDTISSDIHVVSGNTPGMPYLPWVMSKFLVLGFSLEQVIAMATINPAKIINRAPGIGTLHIGAPGDVAIMELVEGPVSFVDLPGNRREGKAYLKPVQTVMNGVAFGRPYQQPFSVR